MSSREPQANNDYLDYAQPQASGGELAQLQKLAEQQARAEAEVKDLEARLNKSREALNDIAQRQVPDLMDQIGITEFKTTTGLFIKIDEIIRASIPKARSAPAFAWLRANGHSALIKRVVSVAFGKGEDEKAEELHTMLEKLEFELEDNSSVHPSTLSSFVKEKLREGEDLPLDLLGVHRQRISKIDLNS